MVQELKESAMGLAGKIQELYKLANELEEMYPGRHFTPDGHMVGSLGEVYAAEKYDLALFEASHPVHDATSADGKLVQIKATQGARIAISECPDYLIALRITHEGEFEELYNGPGEPVWHAAGKVQKTGQRHISISKLKKLAMRVGSADRVASRSHGGGTESAAAFFRTWVGALDGPDMPLFAFIEEAYELGIVVQDYSDRVAGLDAREINLAPKDFCSRLSSSQIVGCIAWHFRQDHFINGSLEESVRSGALQRLMEEYLSRSGNV